MDVKTVEGKKQLIRRELLTMSDITAEIPADNDCENPRRRSALLK
jgi:hypothetical protein